MALIQSDGALRQMSPSYSTFPSAVDGSLTFFNGLTSSYAMIYKTQPNVRMVVDFYARNISQIGIKAFSRVADDDRVSLTGHPISRMLRKPNPGVKLTRQRWMRALVSDLKTYDISFWLKLRSAQDDRLILFRLPPQFMAPVDDAPWYYADKWKFLGVKDQPVFDADDMIVHHGWNPLDPRVGLSPIETIRQILSEGVAATEYREQFWKGGARISGVIERPNTQAGTPRWSDAAKRRFIREFNSNYAGNSPLAGGTPILEDGMTYKQVAFSAKDSEYINARKLSREEVAAVYHLPAPYVGILDNANFSNMQEMHKNLYQDAFGPDLTSIEEDLEMQVVPEYPDLDEDTTYIEFNIAEKLKGSFLDEAAILSTATGRPYMVTNEARARINLPKIEGGDELVTPLNVLVGGQASPRDSAPPTASRGRGHRKDVGDLSDEEQDWHDEHVDVLTSTFERQRDSIVPALGAGQSIEDAWKSRWDAELAGDLLGIATTMNGEIGQEMADLFDGEYDPDLAKAYLEENTNIAAENINNATKQQIADLDAGENDFMDSVRNVFAVALGSRAAQIALSRVTSVSQFSRHDGAEQAGATHKEWRVRSSNSRHPNMNGEKVPIGEKFSNGARWAGDQQNLDTDETANCTCETDFTKEGDS